MMSTASMMWFIAGASGILGLLVGSFLNVISLRMRTGMGIGGRSRCFSCNTTLRWYNLVPVFSYLFQKGKCQTCNSSISIQYPLVELLTGIAFVVPVLVLPLVGIGSVIAVGLAWLFAAIAIVVAIYDIRHHMIPVSALVLLGLFGLVLVLLPSLYELSLGLYLPIPVIDRLIAGVVLPLPFFLIWLFSRGKLFGLGDVELMIPMGLSLGIVSGTIAIVGAFWLATIVVLIMIFARAQLLRARKGGILQQAIPFGPFLLATWYVLLISGNHVRAFVTFFLGI